MGGCQRVSSSQQKAASQSSTPAESLSARQENLPSFFATLALDQRCSPDLLDDGKCGERCPTQQELELNGSEADGTAGDGPAEELSGVNTNGWSSPPAELQGEAPRMSKGSLFSGMELVTKEVSPCIRETEGSEDNSPAATAGHKIRSLSGSTVNTTVCSSLSNSSQPVSAFSFVNF